MSVASTAFSGRRVARNTVAQIAAAALTAASKAVAAVVVARAVGAAGFGQFSVAWAVTQASATLCLLGVDYLLIREIARGIGPVRVGTALPLAGLLGALTAAGIAGAGALGAGGADLAGALVAGGAYVLISPANQVLRAAFHGHERMGLEVLANAVEGLAGLGALWAFVAADWGLAGALAGLAVGRAAGALCGAAMYVRLWGRPEVTWAPNLWTTMLRAALPMGVSRALTSLYVRVDVIVLAAFAPPKEVGTYAAASLIIVAATVPAVSLSGSLYPGLSRLESPSSEAFQRALRGAVLLQFLMGLVAAGVLTAAAGPLSTRMFGTGFGATAQMTAVLAWVLPVRFANSSVAVAMSASDLQQQRATAMGLAAATNLLLNLALLPPFGAWGAVASTLGAEIALAVFLVAGLYARSPRADQPLAVGATS